MEFIKSYMLENNLFFLLLQGDTYLIKDGIMYVNSRYTGIAPATFVYDLAI